MIVINKEEERNYVFAQLSSLPNAFQYVSVTNYIENLERENKKYKEVIDKAIEYLENNSLYEEEYDYDYEENSYLSGIDDETAKKDLLKILRGEING